MVLWWWAGHEVTSKNLSLTSTKKVMHNEHVKRSPSCSFVFQDSNGKSFCSQDPGTEEKGLTVGISEKSSNNTVLGLAGEVL